MTQTGYSNAVVNAMLGWLKGLAAWVLKLFHLAGGASPLEWFSAHWLQLLVILLLVGVAGDFIIWMIRWRPYWVWFKRKRVIVNDERMLAGENRLTPEEMEDGLEREFIVPNTVVGRRKTASGTPQGRAQKRRVHAAQPKTARTISKDDAFDDLFEVGKNDQEYSDYYEDDVFNVNTLPQPAKPRSSGKKRRKRARAR